MNRALILDRDGVVNREKEYVFRIEDLEFVEGIFDVARFFAQRDFMLIMVTNQAGIARGHYSEEDFLELTRWFEREFSRHDVEISRTYYCPFHPTEGVGAYRKESFDRKPNPGMLLRARDDFDLDLSKSILVGDKESDIEAGRRAGVGSTVMHLSAQSPNVTQADHVVTSLYELKDLVEE